MKRGRRSLGPVGHDAHRDAGGIELLNRERVGETEAQPDDGAACGWQTGTQERRNP